VNVVIVGGGTAGWSTALAFSQHKKYNITVIASKEIPIIGVGESTTGLFLDLIKNNFNELDFIKQTGSTYKIGIKHVNWLNGNDYFNSPLGHDIKDYDYYRLYHIAENKKFTSIQSALMENDQLPFVNGLPIEINHKAYHLDTFKTGQYIKEKLLEQNKVKHIEDTVVQINRNENGYINNLVTKKGKNIKADLYIDCSGFKRLLSNHIPFKSYKDNLLVNKAISFHVKNKNIKNYTQATALKNGWVWEIPLQHRTGCGYVFCDKFITDEEAIKELEEYVGDKIEIQKIISFNSGRLEKTFDKNVLTIGLSTAFVEPLEATSIHMSIFQINHYLNNADNFDEKSYNKEIGDYWDNIRDFIILHYRSKRIDSEFWKLASSNKMLSDNLKTMLDIWKDRPPTNKDYGLFSKLALGNTLWLQILLGMNLLNKNMVKKHLIYKNYFKKAENEYINNNSIIKYIKNKAIKNNTFYVQR
jgi:tryptophan halogenase